MSVQAAAARRPAGAGCGCVVLTTRLEGEAREAARVLVAILRESRRGSGAGSAPVCLLAGGETTVTVRGDGPGRPQPGDGGGGRPAPSRDSRRRPWWLASPRTGSTGRATAAGGIVDDTTTRPRPRARPRSAGCVSGRERHPKLPGAVGRSDPDRARPGPTWRTSSRCSPRPTAVKAIMVGVCPEGAP